MKEFYKKNEYITNIIATLIIMQIALGGVVVMPAYIFYPLYIIISVAMIHYITNKQVNKIKIKKKKTFMFLIMYLPTLLGAEIYLIYKNHVAPSLENVKDQNEVIEVLKTLKSQDALYIGLLENLILVLIVSILISIALQVYLIYKEIKTWK